MLTYDSLKDLTQGAVLPVVSMRDDHFCIIDSGRDPRGKFFRVRTFRSDDFINVEVFYEDGSHTESIRKIVE